MPHQTRTHPQPTRSDRADAAATTDAAIDAAVAAAVAEADAIHTALLDDDLLDEIDAVLEHNAVEILRRFVQKGGQ